MGMFDTIICRMPLPGWTGSVDDFQSKDLDLQLDTFEIDADGRLLHHRRRYNPKTDDMESTGIERVPTFDGTLNFYTLVGESGNPDYQWWEWNAKFEGARCVEIARVSPRTLSP